MSTTTSTRHRGRIKWVSDGRDFAFILRDCGQRDVFVHLSEFPNLQIPPTNSEIEFEISTAADGRLKAIRANVIEN